MIIRTSDNPGKIAAEVTIPKGSNWREIKKSISALSPGIKNLVIQLKGDGNVEVDWVRFD
ncbi:MAG: hypothetical protein M3N14_00560, partial [Bacteroidota bacterium]|nr:hypothetical protein [Bacteroidota bacterium]